MRRWNRVELAQIDFEALGLLCAEGHQNTAARLRSSLEQRLERMIRANQTRIDYAEKLAEMIDRYNSGAANITVFVEDLKRLASSLTEEEERHVREELTEEELAVFDLLTNPDPIETLFDGGTFRRVRPLVGHPQVLRRSRARLHRLRRGTAVRIPGGGGNDSPGE